MSAFFARSEEEFFSKPSIDVTECVKLAAHDYDLYNLYPVDVPSLKESFT